MIGKRILHYKILEKLGAGGMGVVYKAEDTKLKRTVALKFLSPELTRDAEAKKRFVREAQAASALEHPNICNIHEIGETDDGRMFIVMACYKGQTLKERIGRGQLTIDKAIEITIQIAQGLARAHEEGIVHRDIKPANIIITDRNEVKILDFGLAKLTGQAQLTKDNSTLGTVAYMSPEQLSGKEVDQRTDIWSLGVVFYEMLMGQLPFQGDYEAAIIYEILNAEPKTIQAFKSDVSDHIISLVFQLLQKDPAHRLSSTKDIMDQLQLPLNEKVQEDEKKSIAVLYLENMSSEQENEYFCAGITEDLIIDLSKIQELKVIPRSDVLPFRNKEVNSRQVGETLRVNYILEGSVRKAGNRIRITAQLIDVKSGYQVWAERYDRFIEDLFDVQIEVSEKIAEALKISLTESEKQSLARKPTDDLRAYDFYIRGIELLLKKGKKNIETAIQMFEHALSIDSNFSLAYVGISEACTYNYIFYDGDRSWLVRMMEMNEKALSIDPDLLEAQFGIGMVYAHQKRYSKAIRSFEKVINLKEDFYPAYFWSGLISWVLKDYKAATQFFQKAAVIKSYSEEPWHYLDVIYRSMGKYESAEEAENRMLELASRRLEVDPENVATLSRMMITFANKGEGKKALDIAKRVLEIDPNDGVAIYNCACTYAILKKKEEAFDYLEAAFNTGFINIADWIPHDPSLDSIRDDTRFEQILSRYGV